MTTIAAILKHKGYQVTTIDPTAKIEHVVAVLAEHRIGAALVMDRAEQLLGIVSERDIVRSLAANGARTLEMTAGQLMTRALQVAHPETTVAEAMTRMTVGRFRHMPVMDHDVLVGADQHRRRGEGTHHGAGERGRQPEGLRLRVGLTAMLLTACCSRAAGRGSRRAGWWLRRQWRRRRRRSDRPRPRRVGRRQVRPLHR